MIPLLLSILLAGPATIYTVQSMIYDGIGSTSITFVERTFGDNPFCNYQIRFLTGSQAGNTFSGVPADSPAYLIVNGNLGTCFVACGTAYIDNIQNCP